MTTKPLFLNRDQAPGGTPDATINMGGTLSSGATSVTFTTVPTWWPSTGIVRGVLWKTGDGDWEYVDVDLSTRSTSTFTFARATEEAALHPASTHSDGAGFWVLATAGMLAQVPSTPLASQSAVDSTTDYTTTSATFAAVDSQFNFTITTGPRRVLISFAGTAQTPVSANHVVYLDVEIDGVLVGTTQGIVTFQGYAAGAVGDASFQYLTPVLTAGSHTIKLMFACNAGATGKLLGSGGRVLTFSVQELADSEGAGSAVTDYIHIQEQQAQNTGAGTFTSGGWRTRLLNTKVADTGGIATLASNQIALPAGTYRVFARCPAYRVDNHQSRLYDVTNSAVLRLGSTGFSYQDSSDFPQTDSIVEGEFTLAAPATIELQHFCGNTLASNGFGRAANIATEVYASIELWRGAAVTGGSFGAAGSGALSARATGSLGGDHSTASTTLVNIHASAYDLVIAAAAGDILEIAGTVPIYATPGRPRMILALDVGGTAVDKITNHQVAQDGEVEMVTFAYQHVVTSGQISGGNVTIRPQYRVTSSTGYVQNSGDGRPHFNVKNLRQ